MKSFIKRFADWLNRAEDGETHSAPLIFPSAPVPPDRLPPPPEPSCFVKGLIHSMKTEPDKWKRTHGFMGNIYWLRTGTGVMLYENDEEPYFCPSFPLPKRESALLVSAITEYLVGPMNQSSAQRARQEEVKKRAPFEKLGCLDRLT